jgi:hypothetical protein
MFLYDGILDSGVCCPDKVQIFQMSLQERGNEQRLRRLL